MIIKLDHITYVTERKKVNEVIGEFNSNGYVLKFKEIDLPNISIKKMLMKNIQETHDLYFFEKKDSFSVEVIAYDQVCSGGVNYYEDGIFTVEVKDKENIYNIAKLFGTKIGDEEDKCNIRGIFDKQTLQIHMIENANSEEKYLDTEGYGCLTFLVDSVERTKEAIKDFKCSDISTLVVNGKELKIFFVTLDESKDLIIEFFSLGVTR